MSELEKLPERKKNFTDVQKDYNLSSKTFIHIIGTNISLFICMLLPVLLVTFIWMDFGIPQFTLKLLSEGIVTVAMIVIGESLMMQVGSSGGKLDSEYLSAKKTIEETLRQVSTVGTMLLPAFCAWQVDLELENAIATRYRYLNMSKETWEKVKDLSKKELVKKYGRRKAKIIIELKTIEPIELNESLLLFNTRDGFARGGVPISGEEFIYKKTHSPALLLTAIFAGLVTVSVAISLTSDFNFARVIYTIFKLVMLLFRMAAGYATGAKAFNSIEVKQLSARNHYLATYVRFVEKKTYLKLGDKYGDLSAFIPDEEEGEDAEATETPETSEEPQE